MTLHPDDLALLDATVYDAIAHQNAVLGDGPTQAELLLECGVTREVLARALWRLRVAQRVHWGYHRKRGLRVLP